MWFVWIFIVSLHAQKARDVAQSGLEYTSGGRGVAGSNPVIPTKRVLYLWIGWVAQLDRAIAF